MGLGGMGWQIRGCATTNFLDSGPEPLMFGLPALQWHLLQKAFDSAYPLRHRSFGTSRQDLAQVLNRLEVPHAWPAGVLDMTPSCSCLTPRQGNVLIFLYAHTVHLYMTLHYITSRYVALRYVTFRYVPLRSVTFRYTSLHYITLHYITLQYITLHYITLQYITLHYIALHDMT